MASNTEKSAYYGALQDIVDALFARFEEEMADMNEAERMAYNILHPPTVRRLDVILAAESADLPDDLREIVELLPPGSYTRRRLCDQINSAISGHAWGQVYGTVE